MVAIHPPTFFIIETTMSLSDCKHTRCQNIQSLPKTQALGRTMSESTRLIACGYAEGCSDTCSRVVQDIKLKHGSCEVAKLSNVSPLC